MHIVHQAADFLRAATHLSLFGFDMVVQNKTGMPGMFNIALSQCAV